ncbi:phosphotransferase family protein [Naasia sp. SYSU D00057]|uniref:phosphotransferase family protein n=1 Tax=Naasia sp. SYSU D00057 TaxID=2817380 RepID=UPI001B3180DB|nr:phosphotransferase [Naasia sp. SYSU D00057]
MDLGAAVAAALTRDVNGLSDVRRDPLEYDAFLAHRAVTRVSGVAHADGERIPWSMIEKTTEGPHLAVPYLIDNGDREYAAYASGLLDDLAPAVRAPRVFGMSAEADGRKLLWLEEIRHEGTRPLDAQSILAAARDLGGLGGRWLGRDLREPWLFRGWIDRHAQPEAAEKGLATLRRRDPAVVARLGDRLDAAERLILAQPRVRAVLEALPQTLCHHDAVGANVFRSGGEVVLIDWESVGPGSVGADLASLLFSSVRRGDASANVVAPLLDEAFAAYLDGLREEAPGADGAEVRRGLDAAIALRWKQAVDVADSLERGAVPRRGSLPDEAPEDALAELIVLTDVLLEASAPILD